jgi:hypothetical protein
VIRAALVLLSACAAEHGPQLSSVMPPAARGGETVTITGKQLCDGNCAAAGGSIVIGYDTPVERARSTLEYADTTAKVRIPTIAPAGETVLIVTVNERSSNALDFEVLPP